MGVGAQRHTERAGQAKIGQLEIAILVNQQILGLQVTMQDPVGVAVADALAQLHHELLDHLVVHAQRLPGQPRPLGQRLAPATLADGQRLHVLLQVEVEELKDQIQLVAVGVDNVEQADNVGVVHLLEEGDLANGRGWHALILGFEADLLQRDDSLVFGGEVPRLVDDSVGAWGVSRAVKRLHEALCTSRGQHTLSNLLQFLVVLHRGPW